MVCNTTRILDVCKFICYLFWLYFVLLEEKFNKVLLNKFPRGSPLWYLAAPWYDTITHSATYYPCTDTTISYFDSLCFSELRIEPFKNMLRVGGKTIQMQHDVCEYFQSETRSLETQIPCLILFYKSALIVYQIAQYKIM